MRAGDAELRPSGTRVLLLDGFALDDDLWAKFQIPIGLAFFMLRERGQGVLALYPSPAGATESELHLAAWDELVAANPVLERARARGRGADRQPDERAAPPRDRADRPLLRARRHDQVALGGHLRRPRDRRRGGRVLRRRSTGRPGGELGAGSRRPARGRRAPATITPEFAVLGVEVVEDAAAPTLRFRLGVSEADAARDLHDRADRADQRRAGAARPRRGDARAARRPLRRARALAGDDAPLRVGAGDDARADVHRARACSRSRCRRRSTSRSPPRATSPACPTARCRSRSTSAARSCCAATTAASRSSRCRGRARPPGACRSRPGAR